MSPPPASISGLEADSVLRLRLKWNAQLEQLHEDIREFFEEDLTVLCVSLDMLLELFILDKRHICWKHHQRLGLHILVLLWPFPVLPAPFFVHQQAEIFICDSCRAEGPRPTEAATVCVTPP